MVLSLMPELFVGTQNMVLVREVLYACQILPCQYRMELGKITLGDILGILVFEDPIVVIEVDGEGIWDTLEAALEKYPSQEG